MVGLIFTRLQLFVLMGFLLLLTGLVGHVVGEAVLEYERDRAEQALDASSCFAECDDEDIEAEMRDNVVDTVKKAQFVSGLLQYGGGLWLFFALAAWKRR